MGAAPEKTTAALRWRYASGSKVASATQALPRLALKPGGAAMSTAESNSHPMGEEGAEKIEGRYATVTVLKDL